MNDDDDDDDKIKKNFFFHLTTERMHHTHFTTNVQIHHCSHNKCITMPTDSHKYIRAIRPDKPTHIDHLAPLPYLAHKKNERVEKRHRVCNMQELCES